MDDGSGAVRQALAEQITASSDPNQHRVTTVVEGMGLADWHTKTHHNGAELQLRSHPIPSQPKLNKEAS